MGRAQSVTQVINGGTGARDAATARANLGAASSSDAVPSGMISFIDSGACPSGWTEDDALATYNVLVTTSAAGDVGTYAGQSLTAAAQAVNSLTAAAQTITYPVNVPAIGAGSFTQATIGWPLGTPTIAGGTFTQPVIAAGTFTQPTIAAGTFTQPTIAWPVAPTNVPTASGAAFSIVTQDYNTGTTAYGPKSLGGTTLASGTTSITLSTQPTIAWPTKVPTASAGAFSEGVISGGSFSEGAISGGAFTEGAISWPAGVPASTGAGFTEGAISWPANPPTNSTSAVTGTMNSSAVTGNTAYYKVIACKKN